MKILVVPHPHHDHKLNGTVHVKQKTKPKTRSKWESSSRPKSWDPKGNTFSERQTREETKNKNKNKPTSPHTHKK